MSETRLFMKYAPGTPKAAEDVDQVSGEQFLYVYDPATCADLGMVCCDYRGRQVDPSLQGGADPVADVSGVPASPGASSEPAGGTVKSAGEEREYRIGSLVKVIGSLPPPEEKPALYTKDGEGPPNVGILNQALDEIKGSLERPVVDVTAEERDEAWDRFKGERK